MHTFLRQAAAVIAGLVFVFSARADWGIFLTYAFLDAGDGMIGYAGNSNADGVPSFVGTSFTFVEGQSSFTLEGGEIKTWKNGGSNVCGGNLFYRVYSAADVPGDFADIALGYQSELANAGDQKWGAYDQHIDLLSGLALGDYSLEVFWKPLREQRWQQLQPLLYHRSARSVRERLHDGLPRRYLRPR